MLLYEQFQRGRKRGEKTRKFVGTSILNNDHLMLLLLRLLLILVLRLRLLLLLLTANKEGGAVAAAAVWGRGGDAREQPDRVEKL